MGINCTPIQRKPFRVCIGDLRKKIIIYTRSITSPLGSSVDFGESLVTSKIVYSMIETANGETIFDGTSIERILTHKFYIRFIAGLTQESWLQFNGRFYDIITIENLNEESRFMLINCNVRGLTSEIVNDS